MRILEAILAIAFLLGIFMDVPEVDGATTAATFSAFVLIFIYFFLGFLFFKKGPPSKRTVLTALVPGILYAFAVAGIQFKWMLYPGSVGTTRAGLLGLALSPLLIFAVHKGNKSVNNHHNRMRFVVMSSHYLTTFMVSAEQIIEWKTKGRSMETEALKNAI